MKKEQTTEPMTKKKTQTPHSALLRNSLRVQVRLVE